MRVYGVDFTSAPTRRKPITVAAARLDGDRLRLDRLEALETLDGFEAALATPGRWIAGLDLPFTQSRTLLANLGWLETWDAYAARIAALDRGAWRRTLEAYKADRAPGDREHARGFERGTGAVSPQKLHGVPVALMHHAAVPALWRAGVHLPGLRDGDRTRVVVEAYPGVAARALVGRRSYKSDERARQTDALRDARRDILDALTGEAGQARFGLAVAVTEAQAADLVADPGGDRLDALLCAAQAAWAHRALAAPGALDARDLSEGWIADPDVVARLPPRG